MSTLLLAVATGSNGLLAGLFFSFAVAISPGLRQVEDQEYVYTFRAVNRAIQNPTFLTVYFAAVASLVTDNPTALPWTALGAAGSVVTFGITTVVNVPLNNMLARTTSTTEEVTVARQSFEPHWNKWNTVRTLTSTAALVCFVLTGVTTGHS